MPIKRRPQSKSVPSSDWSVADAIRSAASLPGQLEYEIRVIEEHAKEPIVKSTLAWSLPRFEKQVAYLKALVRSTPCESQP